MIADDDRYEVEQDPYCYAGTDVLKNKAKLKDEKLLSEFEVEMSTLRSREPLPDGAFDPAHYQAVHRYLFQDVYAWAGKYREVQMSKGGSVFCHPEFIAGQAKKLFRSLGDEVFMGGASRTDFIAAVAEFLAELNAIHCFRDGNGRAQLTFMHLVAERAGHPLKLERVKRGTFLPAMIASFNGDLGPLKRELGKLYPPKRKR